ncbi:small integral membrane protein 26-like isoform X2 [Heptranchias perlo]|uniref:small integral membrane protein 26-like isoform X2 n=1 Tax=Heptranchias perlo TaxID=212740 RepID=UPI00355A9C62
MNLKEIARWNVRVSLVYALGIWTMLGTYGFFQLKKKREQAIIGSSAEDSAATYQEELQTNVEPEKKTKKEFVDTNVVLKENFVPFSSRIYSYGKSVFGDSSDTSTEERNSEK